MMSAKHYPMKSDVREKKDSYLLEIDLPGCRKEDRLAIVRYCLKQYLRIDFEDDDPLLLSLIFTAKQLVMDVGRMDETQLAENEDVVRTAMLYTVSYLYENRNTADFSRLTLTLRAMLFAQREGVM